MNITRPLSSQSIETITNAMNKMYQFNANEAVFTPESLLEYLNANKINPDYSFIYLNDDNEINGISINIITDDSAFNLFTGNSGSQFDYEVIETIVEHNITFFSMYGISEFRINLVNDIDAKVELYRSLGFEKYNQTNSYNKRNVNLDEITDNDLTEIKSLNKYLYDDSIRNITLKHGHKYLSEKNIITYFMINHNTALSCYLCITNFGTVKDLGFTNEVDFNILLQHIENQYPIISFNEIEENNSKLINLLLDNGYSKFLSTSELKLNL